MSESEDTLLDATLPLQVRQLLRCGGCALLASFADKLRAPLPLQKLRVSAAADDAMWSPEAKGARRAAAVGNGG
jgi:hypothetical protein